MYTAYTFVAPVRSRSQSLSTLFSLRNFARGPGSCWEAASDPKLYGRTNSLPVYIIENDRKRAWRVPQTHREMPCAACLSGPLFLVEDETGGERDREYANRKEGRPHPTSKGLWTCPHPIWGDPLCLMCLWRPPCCAKH